MTTKLNITVSSHDLAQLLDGIRIRAEARSKTTDYLDSGFNPDDAFICEKCSDPKEARRIAHHYETIISKIEQQVQKQEGK